MHILAWVLWVLFSCLVSLSAGKCAGSATLLAQPSEEYRYSVKTDLLTAKQRAFYEENGFLVIRKLVPREKLDVYR